MPVFTIDGAGAGAHAMFTGLEAPPQWWFARRRRRNYTGFRRGHGLPPFGDGLGATVCIEGDCNAGEARVAQLVAFFDSAGRPKPFEAAVAGVVGAYKDAESRWSRQLPYSPVCCEISVIGLQAEKLRMDIARALGVEAGPAFEDPGSFLSSALKTAIVLAIIGGVAYAGVRIYNEYKGRGAR